MPKINWPSGVYCIINKANGKRYIGSAVNLANRRQQHRRALNKSVHPNRHLQSAWNKYGNYAFRFVIILRCPPEECIQNEQRYIDLYDAANPQIGYNLSPTAGSTLGVKYSLEARQRLKEILGTDKYKMEHSARMKARNTPEYIDKLSASIKESWKKGSRLSKHMELASNRFQDKVATLRKIIQSDRFTRKDIERAIGLNNAYATVRRLLKEGIILIYDKGRSVYSRPAVYVWANQESGVGL